MKFILNLKIFVDLVPTWKFSSYKRPWNFLQNHPRWYFKANILCYFLAIFSRILSYRYVKVSAGGFPYAALIGCKNTWNTSWIFVIGVIEQNILGRGSALLAISDLGKHPILPWKLHLRPRTYIFILPTSNPCSFCCKATSFFATYNSTITVWRP